MYFIPVYILILFLTIVIDYIAGRLIENAEGRKRKWLLVLSIVANVGVLAFFKYYNFFVDTINSVSHSMHGGANVPLLNIILPIGLSFHTFQAMSYTIEVYRGNQAAERHFGIYALYVMFYPQLVAGPIETPQNLLHQFHEKKEYKYTAVVSGLRLITWGMLKKVVIADRLGLVVNPIYDHAATMSATALFIGALFFIFQIYCDFSAYSDIALGTARVMGFELMVNFNRPFASKSVSEFWSRWHISLSAWFRDYVYFPISASLRSWGKPAIAVALLITFFLSGLWHGADWKYVIWGLVLGCAIVYEIFTRNIRSRIFGVMPQWLNDTLSRIITFLFVTLAAVFFRADSSRDAVFILKKITHVPSELLAVLRTKKLAFLQLPGLFNVMLPCFALILFLQVAQVYKERFRLEETFNARPALLRWFVYYAGIFMIIHYGVFERTQFIYFQF